MTKPTSRLRRSLPCILSAFIGLMVLSAYSNTFTSPPFLDDFHSFVTEKSLYLEDFSLSSLWSLTQTKFGMTRLLPVVTLALNHSMGNSNLIYFHAVNILIHLLSFLAVFWLFKQILSTEKNRSPEGVPYDMGGYFPLCVAALWALSPVQTSAVTYLVQRMASMQALFFALSVACFIKARLLAESESGKSTRFYVLCGLSALGSLLSKENSVMLPILFVCTDIWLFDAAWTKRAWAYCRKTGWKLRLVGATAVLSSLAYAFAVVLPKLLVNYDKRHFTLVERLLTEGRVVVWYMSLLLWPDPFRLSMEHEVAISRSLFSPISTLPALLLIGALIFLTIRFRKRFPAITYGTAWFFMNLAIESTILPLELVFEHRLYLPSMGFYLSVTAIFVLLGRRAAVKMSETDFTKAACSILLVASSVFAMMTFMRNADWRHQLTIHFDTVTKAPESPRANASYANVLNETGRYEEAMAYAEKSIELGIPGHETWGLAQNALTIALHKLDRLDEAVERGEKFLAQKKRMDGDALPHLCLNLAQIYIRKDRPGDAYRMAIEALKFTRQTDNAPYKKEYICKVLLDLLHAYGLKGVDLNGDGSPDPGDMPDALWLALELKQQGEAQFVLQVLDRLRATDAENPRLAAGLDDFRRDVLREAEQDRTQQAKWDFSRKYVRHPFSKFNFCMAIAYLVQEKHLMGVFSETGERFLDAAMETDPGSPDAWLLKGWYLYQANKSDEAVAAAHRAIRHDGENAKAWLGLGFFLGRTGATQEAIAAFERAIEIYPRYSKRAMIESLCAQLRKGEKIESAQSGQNESRVKAGLPGMPKS